jgi:hypothetical protein
MINYMAPLSVGCSLMFYSPFPIRFFYQCWKYYVWQLSTSENHVLLLCANMSKPVLRLRRSCEAWSFVVSGNIPGCSGVLRRLMVCSVNFHIGIIFICIKKWKKSPKPVQRAAKRDAIDMTTRLCYLVTTYDQTRCFDGRAPKYPV